MREIIDFGNGLKWHEIETQQDAMEETELARHAVGYFFRDDLHAANGETAQIARYYSLRREQGGTVIVVSTARVPAETEIAAARNTSRQLAMPIVVGYANGDPYPEYGAEISTLASHVGVSLPPSCFPNRNASKVETDKRTAAV